MFQVKRSGAVSSAIIFSIALLQPVTAMADEDALFQYKGRSYSASDLPNHLRQSLYKVQNENYGNLHSIAGLAVFELYLEAESKRRGVSQEAVAGELLSVPRPNDAEVERFYNQNRSRIGAPLEQVREQIVQYIVNGQLDQQRKAFIAKLTQQGGFKLAIEEPKPPIFKIVTDGYPFKGNPNAAITLVEFADYQCPHCKQVSMKLKPLMKRFGKQVKLVFRDFPINRSGISTRVAEGAVCADRQGKFWGYHDMAFDMQKGLNPKSPNDFAEILGLDLTAFGKCLDDPATKAKVARSKAEAMSLGINSTPTLYLNGRLISDHDNQGDLAEEIKRAISENR